MHGGVEVKRARAWSVVSRALVGAGVLAALAALVAYLALTWDLPDVRSLAERKPAPSNLIVDRQGRLLYEVINPQVGKHVPVRLSQVPLALRQATVATEDARFGQHHGVDFVAVARAYGLKAWHVNSAEEFRKVYGEALQYHHPSLIELMIEDGHECKPRLAFGRKLDEQFPQI